jgi:ribonuclease VapC
VIVVDTSALVAILKEEIEAVDFAQIIADAERCFLSAVGLFEASMVMIGRGSPDLARGLDELIHQNMIEVVPFDEALARESRAAFVRFGRGRHPASLNFGDCITYALARSLGLPLLFKGADFGKTDVTSALG